MRSVLILSYVLLWILVSAMVAAVATLGRQIGLINRRIPPVGARGALDGPAIGESAPPLDEMSVTGGRATLGAPEGRSTLVLFLSTTCSICLDLAPGIRGIVKSERHRLDVVISMTGDERSVADFLDRSDLAALPVFTAIDAKERYGVSSSPFAVLVDEKGFIRSKGLVNHREHLDSLVAELDKNDWSQPLSLTATTGMGNGAAHSSALESLERPGEG